MANRETASFSAAAKRPIHHLAPRLCQSHLGRNKKAMEHLLAPDNGKWERCEPLEWIGNLQRFLIAVEKDPKGCFKR
jgi:hypothetical protein